MADNWVCMEGNKDNISQITGHNLQASVGQLMLDRLLDDKHALLQDNEATA
jgi:hypothetical protein